MDFCVSLLREDVNAKGLDFFSKNLIRIKTMSKTKDKLQTELFNNENLEQAKQKDDFEINAEGSTDDAINAKYIRGDVRIVTEQARYPLGTIKGLINSEKYKIDPDFQRRRRWNVQRKSNLIESFIMNIPIPPIFLYEKDYASYEVMDGQQRLSAIYEFYEDKYALEGLQEWKELNGKKYSELPDRIKAGIDRRYISSIILLQETAKTEEDEQRLKQLVFDRINSGGIQLEPQESRNAVYAGPLNDLCKELSENLTLKKLWFFLDDEELKDSNPEILKGKNEQESWDIVCEQSESYRKMDDVELVLRFFAYRQLDKFPRSLPLRDILDRFLQEGNSFPSNVLDEYRELFISTIDLVYEVLGNKAFQLYRKDARASTDSYKWSLQPLKVVYDPIMYAFSQKTNYAEQLISKKDDFMRELRELYKKNGSLFSGRKTTPTDTLRRMNLMLDHLNKFLS